MYNPFYWWLLLAFHPKILGGGGTYECMFSGGDTMRWWAHSNPISCKKNYLNLLHSKAVGMQKLQASAPSRSPMPPGETFTIILLSRRTDPDESDAGCGGAGLQFRTDGFADAQTERATAGLHRWVRRAQRARAERWRCRRNWSKLSPCLNWLLSVNDWFGASGSTFTSYQIS